MNCAAPACTFRATHGARVLSMAPAEYLFCHTHWWMLPNKLRSKILNGGAVDFQQALRAAYEWHEEEAGRSSPRAEG